MEESGTGCRHRKYTRHISINITNIRLPNQTHES
jgi:hypothetical protein